MSSIDYDFYDIREFYKALTNTTKNESVVHLLELLNIEGEQNTHDAGADAYNTMLETKAILEKANKTLEEMIEICPEARDRSHNYLVDSIEKRNEEKKQRLNQSLENGGTDLSYGKRTKLYLKFLKNLKINSTGLLKDKKISICLNYEESHFRQILNLSRIIANQGGEIVRKATTADIYVRYDVFLEDGTTRNDSKLNYVNEAISNGVNIKVITLADLLTILNITEEELNKLPMPTL